MQKGEIKCWILPKAVRELDQNEIVVFASAVKLSQRNSNLIWVAHNFWSKQRHNAEEEKSLFGCYNLCLSKFSGHDC